MLKWVRERLSVLALHRDGAAAVGPTLRRHRVARKSRALDIRLAGVWGGQQSRRNRRNVPGNRQRNGTNRRMIDDFRPDRCSAITVQSQHTETFPHPLQHINSLCAQNKHEAGLIPEAFIAIHATRPSGLHECITIDVKTLTRRNK